MKKILYIVLLSQSFWMTAQTETILTPNGKKVQIDTSPAWSLDGNNSTGFDFLGTKNAFDLPVVTNGTEKMRLTKQGKVLINSKTVNDPNAVLQIEGQPGVLQIVDGTQGTGKVLTSDANGATYWKASAVGTQIYSYSIAHPASVTLPYPPGQGLQIGSNFSITVAGMYRIFVDVNLPPGYILQIGDNNYHFSQTADRFYRDRLVYLSVGTKSIRIYNDNGQVSTDKGGPYWSFNVYGPVN